MLEDPAAPSATLSMVGAPAELHPPGMALWHPFANMAEVAGNEVVLERGEGSWLWDESGRRYLDATSGLWFCNVGHGRRELVDAAAAQMAALSAYHLFDVYANRPALELAERLITLAPTGPGSAVFLTTGGSDAVDTAAKIARRYWRVAGEPDRQVIVARAGAYHGSNAYGTALGGIVPNASGWGQLVADVVHVPPHDPEALAHVLERDAKRVAAFIGEPVIGAGGVEPPVDGYWTAVQDICHRHHVLLIADEVITGFGRLGTWFASDYYGIEPDIVTTAKGITSGYLPLGAVVCGERVRSELWSPAAGALRHGYTYSGHAAACAVALRNLDVIELERLLPRVNALAPMLERRLGALVTHPLVSEVRTAGLLAGIELDPAALEEEPALADRIVREARAHGVITRTLVGTTLQITPPFVITEDEIEDAISLVREALDGVLRGQLVAG